MSKTKNDKAEEGIVRLVTSLPDGTFIVERDGGQLERLKSETDWARVDALTDAEIEEAVRNDPDAVPLDFNWSEATVVVPPKKKAISIRVDEDVLDFFKTGGAGYQRRMNAVLRSYMQNRKKNRRA
ncbi:MAG: BrnA antitoxin family protein [Bauldia sp.]|nr:BrnA antitoxin family protein [Bauldia sp.]